jgi:Fur family iron response transcriptional regulator
MEQFCSSIADGSLISTEVIGPPSFSLRDLLTQAGLRPTRQRLALASLLFTEEARHVTASDLAREVSEAGINLSLATIYNLLSQLTDAGLLHRVSVGGDVTYFDTKAGDHHHFFIEDDNCIFDVPAGSIAFGRLPDPPEGYVITRVDVVIRLKRIDQSHSRRIPEGGLAELRTVTSRPRFGGISA